ncbi:hypothetical protein BSKO_13398 [Bryopsis sp. KO-2023]|nr:hypothetical protein BSKO_13398 [Bryopsis sp. KO-2023]
MRYRSITCAMEKNPFKGSGTLLQTDSVPNPETKEKQENRQSLAPKLCSICCQRPVKMRAAVFVVSLALLGLAAGDRINDLPNLRRQLQGKHPKKGSGSIGVPSVTIGSVNFPSATVSIPGGLPQIPTRFITSFRRSVLQLFKDNFVNVNVQIGNPAIAVDGIVSGLVPELTKFFADAFVDVRDTVTQQGASFSADFSETLATELLETIQNAFSEAMTTTLPGFVFPNNFGTVFQVLPGRVVTVITTSPTIFTGNPASIAGLIRRPFTTSLKEIFQTIAPGFISFRTNRAIVTGGPGIVIGSASAGRNGPGAVSVTTGASLPGGNPINTVTTTTTTSSPVAPAPVVPAPVAPAPVAPAPVAPAPVAPAPVVTASGSSTVNPGTVAVTTTSSGSNPQGTSTVSTGGPGPLPTVSGPVSVQTSSPGSQSTVESSSITTPTGTVSGAGATATTTSTSSPAPVAVAPTPTVVQIPGSTGSITTASGAQNVISSIFPNRKIHPHGYGN